MTGSLVGPHRRSWFARCLFPGHPWTGFSPLRLLLAMVTSVVAKLDLGKLQLTGIKPEQSVGIALSVNFYTGFRATNVIVYKGPETNALKRHVFEVVDRLGSTIPVERLFASDDPQGQGVTFEVKAGIFPINAGIFYDYQFSSPIFLEHFLRGTGFV